MSKGDSTRLLKPTLLVVGAVVAGVVIVLAVNGALAFMSDTGGQAPAPADGGGDGGGDVIQLPGTWSGSEWYSPELRDEGFEYKNASAGEEVAFVPKEMNNSTLPENENRRELVRYGREIFANTSNEMPDHVGNELSCANCHGGGDLPTTTGMVGQDIDMIPLVGTAAGYPEWTGRTERMRDMRQRIMGCFLRSMDAPGSPEGVPEYDSREVQAMESYMVWLNKGTPSEKVPYWRHIRKPEGDEKVNVTEANPVRGASLYLENCASCHGADGQGKEGQYPPLWGEGSYNDGAGMGRLYTSAGFIREAMPYGAAHTFDDWRDSHDVAAFMNGHKRPHLPRQPKDWAKAGAPDEGIYYQRVQERFGYDMNPMTKKLMIAGIPIGSQEINESVIPDDVDRYDQPLRDVEVNGSWQTTWIRTYEEHDNGWSTNETESDNSTSTDAREVVGAAMDGDSGQQAS